VAAADLYSGISTINVEIPGARWNAGFYPLLDRPAAGSVNDGYWHKTTPFPSIADPLGLPAPGTYPISIRLEDAAGNVQEYSSDELAAAGLPSQFTYAPQ
jgi:hypothetical protein